MILSIFGFIFLISRIWLVEVKLKEELQFRRRYFSRFFSYYAWLALTFSLMAFPFNLMIMLAFPILVVTSVWDINFYQKLNSQSYWAENKKWAILERLTMHPPVVIIAIYMILTDARNYILAPNVVIMIITALILFSPFFIVDERWTKRYKWPEALVVIGLMIVSGASLIIAEVILWGIPIW